MTKFTVGNRVQVGPSFLASTLVYLGQCGEVTAVHAAPQIHVRLDSGQDQSFNEKDLELLVGTSSVPLVEMVNRNPVLMDEKALGALMLQLCAS